MNLKKAQVDLTILIFILSLSAFIHLWNPIGFPSFYVDEGHYMRRALQTLDGLGFQEIKFEQPYDHPYFGQIFLAFIFKIIGYPDSLNPKPGDMHSIEMLYLVPRVLMGLLAVLDTFLVYKISDRMYGRKVAFITSIFFAVMPMTWILRRIYLDSIQLPFLLSSIFFALYYAKSPTKGIVDNNTTKFDIDDSNNKYKQIPVVLLSGIFLGLAIFTKIPVFMMIPLVAYLIYKNSTSINKKGKLKTLGLWFIPVILIPAIWPAYNMLYGHFDEWVDGVLLQTDRIPRPMEDMIAYLLKLDTLLLILAFAGIVFGALKRDAVIILWTLPLFVFLTAINYVGLFHLIPLMPIFCIAAAMIIVELYERLARMGKRKNELTATIGKPQGDTNQLIRHRDNKSRDKRSTFSFGFSYSSIFIIAIVIIIGSYGLATTSSFILTNSTNSFFELYTRLINYLPDDDKNNSHEDRVSIIGPAWFRDYYWMPRYIFNKDIDYVLIGANPKTNKFVFLADSDVMRVLSTPESKNSLSIQQLFKFSKPVGNYQDQRIEALPYPYLDIQQRREIVGNYGGPIQLRANY